MIYLDNNATTPLDPLVLAKLMPLLSEDFGNPNANNLFGEKIHPYLNEASDYFYNYLNLNDEDSFIITSGATESINTVHNSILQDFLLKKTTKNHIITSSMEHPATKFSLAHLKNLGFEITELTEVTPEALEKAIQPDKTALVSLMFVHNETGAISPIKELTAIAKKYDILVHTDGTQAIGKIPVDVQDLGIDFLSCSAHKLHGPKGIGALFVKNNTPFTPLLFGGGHMGGYRSGTLNTYGITGFGEALHQAHLHMDYLHTEIKKMRDTLEEFILSVDGSKIFCYDKPRTPTVSYFSLPNVDSDYMVWALNKAGIAISAGSACASASPTKRSGLKGVRVSLSRLTTMDEIQQTIEQLKKLL